MKKRMVCLTCILCLPIFLWCQIPFGIYRTIDGKLVSVGEMDGKPFIVFNEGEVRGLRPSSLSGKYEVGITLGSFDTIEGYLSISNGGNINLELTDRNLTASKVMLNERRINFKNQRIDLAGTLILPEGIGPFPCIVFTHGSGEETREGNRGLASLFAANGIAALIYDKRGTGKSGGKDWKDSFYNYAQDAIAGAEYLRSQPDINSKKIGIYGHSQGGWIAPLAVSKSDLFSFAILSAANAVSPIEQHLSAGDEEYRIMGMDETTIQEVRAFRLLKYQVGISQKGLEEYKKKWLPEAERKPWFKTTGGALPDNAFWKANGFYDPAPALKELNCPVLIIYGEFDISTNAQLNLPLMKTLIGSKNVEYKVFERANHMLMKVAKKGYPMKQLPFITQFADGYIDLLIQWTKRIVNE